MDWASMIKTIRMTRGLKQQALAALLGVSQSAVSRWESNRGKPNMAVARTLLAMASAERGRSIDLFAAEADANLYPMAISTADGLRIVRWNDALRRRLKLDPSPGVPAHRLMDSTWFDHYRDSGIAAGEMNTLLSHDETRVGRATRFARILTMPCVMRDLVILRIQPISRKDYRDAPLLSRISPIVRKSAA